MLRKQYFCLLVIFVRIFSGLIVVPLLMQHIDEDKGWGFYLFGGLLVLDRFLSLHFGRRNHSAGLLHIVVNPVDGLSLNKPTTFLNTLLTLTSNRSQSLRSNLQIYRHSSLYFIYLFFYSFSESISEEIGCVIYYDDVI